jgi:adenosine deaminase
VKPTLNNDQKASRLKNGTTVAERGLMNPSKMTIEGSGDPVQLKRIFSTLPKTEMHLHIEGAIALDEYREVVDVPAEWTPPGWATDYRYETFKAFEDFILGYADSWYNSPERYARSAKSLFQRKLDEGVRYLECSFAGIVCQMKQLPIGEIVDAIRSVVPPGLEVRLFIGLHHDGWIPETEKPLTDMLHLKNLDGIDLHGPERYPVADWMLDYWPAARAAGKFTKAHAGELGAAWHVREAVEKLGVSRIEHGFRAVEDPDVLELLVAHKMVLDVCPISNFKLKTVASYGTHPLRKLIEAGVICTLNTDDPFIFGNTVADEFVVLGSEAGYDLKTLVQLARNGFEHALVTDEQRRTMLDEFDASAAKVL